MQWLRQSTAITAKIGPFLNDTDGKTAETGLTIAQADVRLSKNGGDIAQKTEATSCTHDELGIYGCPLDTTDTATLGRLQLWVHESGALPVWHEFMVVPANVWDSMFGSDMLKVDVHAIDDDETAANNLESYCDGTTPIPANATQISDDATAADNLELITEIANITSLTVDAAGHLEVNVVEIEDADPTDTIRDAVVDDATRIDASALNTLSGHDPGGTLCADATPLTAAETESEVNDALVVLHLDHLIQVASTVNDAAAAAGDFDTALAEATNDHYNDMIIVFTSGALAGQARRISDYDGTSKNIIITPAFTEAPANSDPFIIVSGGYLKVVAERLDTQAKADVNAEADTALTDYDPPTNAEMEARTLVAASYFDPAADAVADVTLVATTTTNTDMRGTDSAALASVCTETRLAELAAANLPTDIDAVLADTNELQTDDVPGLISALNNVSTAEVNTEVDTALADIHLDHLLAVDYDPASKPGVATALLNELIESDGGVSRYTANALEEAPTGGSAPTVGEIRTEMDDNSTQLAAIVADTNELQTDDIPGAISGLNDPTAAAIRTEIDTNSTQLAAIVADTNELQTDDVPGLISALNDIAVTDVTQRQIPDSYAADGSQPTLEQALLMILQFLSERAVSGTTVTVKKPDGSTTAMSFTLDDDTDPTSITRAS